MLDLDMAKNIACNEIEYLIRDHKRYQGDKWEKLSRLSQSVENLINVVLLLFIVHFVNIMSNFFIF